MSKKVKPRMLYPGDTIGIPSPAGINNVEATVKAAGLLEQMGLKVKFGKTLDKQHGYLAGTDEERAADVNEFFADPEIKGILCARGGYGTARIADLLDYEIIKANPKLFWGYSDITFLHSAIGSKTGLVTFHGPMLVDLINDDHPLTLESFQTMIKSVTFRYTEEISPLEVLVEGEAQGELIGGNVSLLVSTLGTPYEIDTKGKILFLEDIDEEPYRLDRMLNQLKQAGKFDDAAAIMVCDFNNCVPNKRKVSFTLEEVIHHYMVGAGKPALAGFKIGHCSPNIVVPVGMTVKLNTSTKTVEALEVSVTE